MEETAVPKFKHGVIISLPAFKLSDFKAKINADEPELTIRPYFFPNILEIFLSNVNTALPI